MARDSAGNVARDSVTLIRLPQTAAVLTLSSLSAVSSSGLKFTGFLPQTLAYADTVASTDTSVTVSAVASDTTSTVSINGVVGSVAFWGSRSIALGNSGTTTTVSVRVKATSGDSLVYTLRVVRRAAAGEILWNTSITYGTLSDSRDGQSYKTVKIGTQTWMAENLNYRNTTGSTDTVGVCYNNSSDSCTKYGRLYSWATAMGLDTSYDNKIWQGADSAKHQGICPSGWYMPNKTEWSTLIQYVDSVTSGTKLKSTSGWYNSGNGTDIYGFRVLPAGIQSYIIATSNIEFRGASNGASFWSSSLGDEFASSTAWSWDFSYGDAYASSDKGSGSVKANSFSLRCVQGAGSPVSLDTLTTLHSLALDSGTLMTSFDSSVTGYVDSVASTVTSLKVTATASSTSDTVKVNGTAVTSGTATSVNVSTDTTITIFVSNPNTTSTKTYTVRIVHGTSFTETTRILSTYSTVTMDSASTRTVYGIKAFANPSSSVNLSVPGGYVEMQATLAADSTTTFSANAMIDHGLDSLGGEHDLTGLDSVSFEFRNSAAIGDYFSIALGSGAYSAAITNAGQEYEWVLLNATTRSASATTWKRASLSASNLVIPSWVTSVPAEYPSLANVLKRVNFIKFFPKTSYDASNVIPVTTSQTLDVRNISLHFTGR